MSALVRIVEDRVLADSRDVAEQFGKRHADVLRAIDGIMKDVPALERNFAFKAYSLSIGLGKTREARRCDMDRKGFMLLVMGFTGAKALEMKSRWIDAFDAMERALLEMSRPRPVLPDAGELLANYDRSRIQLALNVIEAATRLFGPQSARLMWMKMGLPAPVAAEAPLLMADPMGADLEAFCATVDECTIEQAADALGVTRLDGGMRLRIGKLLRELGWHSYKVRRGKHTVNLFAPRFAPAQEVA